MVAVLSCEAAGGQATDADPVALSVELLHTFSLVHDDLMDQDPTRRGVDAVHEVYGMPTAILAGDALYALAFEVLSELDVPDTQVEIVSDIAQSARRLCEGQHLDMQFEGTWPTVGKYESMTSKKTATLFRCATGNGARAAAPGRETIDALSAFGHALGLGFQIQDDVLDIEGDEATIGKPVGSDIRAGKKTHPILEAHQRANEDERRVLEEVLADDPDDTDVEWVLDLLDETGALATSRERANQLIDGARKRLAGLPDSSARTALGGLVDWLAEREH